MRTRLRVDQIFSCEYLTNLRNLAQFVFNLVVGKFNVSELEGFYREVANYLGGLETFMYDEEFSYDFKWSFIIVICRIVYDSIVNQGYFSKSKAERERIRADLTENGSIGIKLNILDSEVKYKYFEEVDLASRKEFAEYYKKLQFRLNLDQIYGMTFMDEVRYFTTIVFDLIEGRCGRIPSTNFIRFIGEDLLRNWDANLKHKWILKATLSREHISQLMLNEKIEEYNKKLIEQDTMKDNKNDEFNGEKESNSRKEEEYTVENSDFLSESRELIYRNEEIEKQNKEIDEIYAINIENLENFKEKIKKIDWDKISDDWVVEIPASRFSVNKKALLDPYSDCSKANPLYMHKKWLERIYNDEEFNLSDRKFGEVCGVAHSTIGDWRREHNIKAKRPLGKWFDKTSGYIKMYMPKTYQHPEVSPTVSRYVRLEHDAVMEEYLSQHPELKVSQQCLIDGKYLKNSCPVHHINHIRHDNRLENLWVCENQSEHNKLQRNIYECFRDLIKLNQIGFKNGNYYLNKAFDYRNLSDSEIKEILRPIIIDPYENIDLVKEEIKDIDWDEVSDDWTVNYYSHSSKPPIKITVDPYSDCSDENPLYRHKEWVKHLVHHKKYNLTDPRLAKVCGLETTRGALYWRGQHDIKGKKEHGFKRFLVADRPWIKVPEDYEKPTAKRNRGYMFEYRYIMERHLAKTLESKAAKKYLFDGKFLKPEFIVHHINFDKLDSRLENLWVCENQSEHKAIEGSLLFYVDELLKSKRIVFRNGEYSLNK